MRTNTLENKLIKWFWLYMYLPHCFSFIFCFCFSFYSFVIFIYIFFSFLIHALPGPLYLFNREWLLLNGKYHLSRVLCSTRLSYYDSFNKQLAFCKCSYICFWLLITLNPCDCPLSTKPMLNASCILFILS